MIPDFDGAIFSPAWRDAPWDKFCTQAAQRKFGRCIQVGHRAILHGCLIDDDVLIGMGAILLNRCHIGSGSIIGAGALVAEGTVIPPNSLVVGVPGRVVRETTEAERARLAISGTRYRQLAVAHRDGVVRYRAAP